MKRITVLLVLVLFLPVFASAEGEFYTIREIREQAETLMAANGGTVNIQAAHGNFDVPIEVPDIDRVPIIKIDFPLEDQMPEAPENGTLERHLTYDDKYLSGWIGQAGSRDELYGESFKNASRVGQYGLDARADGSLIHPYGKGLQSEQQAAHEEGQANQNLSRPPPRHSIQQPPVKQRTSQHKKEIHAQHAELRRLEHVDIQPGNGQEIQQEQWDPPSEHR